MQYVQVGFVHARNGNRTTDLKSGDQTAVPQARAGDDHYHLKCHLVYVPNAEMPKSKRNRECELKYQSLIN